MASQQQSSAGGQVSSGCGSTRPQGVAAPGQAGLIPQYVAALGPTGLMPQGVAARGDKWEKLKRKKSPEFKIDAVLQHHYQSGLTTPGSTGCLNTTCPLLTHAGVGPLVMLLHCTAFLMQ